MVLAFGLNLMLIQLSLDLSWVKQMVLFKIHILIFFPTANSHMPKSGYLGDREGGCFVLAGTNATHVT